MDSGPSPSSSSSGSSKSSSTGRVLRSQTRQKQKDGASSSQGSPASPVSSISEVISTSSAETSSPSNTSAPADKISSNSSSSIASSSSSSRRGKRKIGEASSGNASAPATDANNPLSGISSSLPAMPSKKSKRLKTAAKESNKDEESDDSQQTKEVSTPLGEVEARSSSKEEISAVAPDEPGTFTTLSYGPAVATSAMEALSDEPFRFLNPEILEELYTLRNMAAALTSKLPRHPSASSNSSSASSSLSSGNVWGMLVSKSQNQRIDLKGNSFAVGPNLIGKDTSTSSTSSSSNSAPNAVSTGNSTAPSSNSLNSPFFRLYPNNTSVVLESMNNSAVSINNKPCRKGQTVNLSNSDEITIAQGHKSQSFVFQKPGKSYESITSVPLRPIPSLNDVVSPLPSSSSRATRSKRKASSPQPPILDAMETDPTGDPNPLSPLLPPPISENELEISKKQMETLKNQFKHDLKKLLLAPNDIDVSFEKFPYFVNDKTKQLLIHSAYVYLKKPEFARMLSELPHSRRILLSGPSGSDIYQELLVKALAKHFEASVMILDPSHMEIEKTSTWDSLGDESDQRARDSLLPKTTKKRDGSKHTCSNLCRVLRHGNSSSSKHNNSKVVIAFDDNSHRKSSLGGLRGGSVSDKLSLTDLGFEDDAPNFFMDNMDIGSGGNGGHSLDSEGGEDRMDSIFLESLFELLSEDKKPCILFVKELENSMLTSYERYIAFKRELNKISTPILIIGSSVSPDFKKEKNHSGLLFSKSGSSHHTTALLDLAIFDHIAKMEERAKETSKTTRYILKLFPTRINILPPSAPEEVTEWNKQMSKDMEQLKLDKNVRAIKKILERNGLECSEINSPMLRKEILSSENLEKVIGWAMIDHLMSSEQIVATPDASLPKLTLSLKSLEHGLTMLKNSDPEAKSKIQLKDVEVENEFERRLLSEVIPPNELDIKFQDIGALDEVKKTLQELVMLPLQRPELFCKGNLTSPCKGILLFGPPGTGKTMLAKAVATQSGANFINISMSTIASKWFGEGEKYVKAVFTLASKIAPTVIFVDEVDSILGKRDRAGEHEAMRKIKNEFMSNWDGLRTKPTERVLVMGATNRPFDLDDAVLRRLPRRLLIDLPSVENRLKIFKVILKNEELSSDFDFEEIAALTEGFSGSDLKNLCVAAAYQPIREILEKEKEENELKQKLADKEEVPSPSAPEETASVPSKEVYIRPLKMSDFIKSLKEISASVSEEAFSIGELRKWNEIYGEGGNRRKESLSYFM